MAQNLVHTHGIQMQVALANVTNGDPVVVGQLPAVALTSTDGGNVIIQTDGVFTFTVKGVDKDGNAAVAVGDIVYYVAEDTPKLSKKVAGVRFGYALDAVSSGATGTAVRVKIGY